jgi:hypothetical protein
MRPLLRLSAGALVAAALLLGGSLAAVAGLAVLRLGLSDLGCLVAEERRHDELDARLRALQECHDGKRLVVEELLDGRLSLWQAVGAFRRLHEAAGDGLRRPLPAVGGATVEESLARSVLAWAEAAQRDRPTAERAAVLRRLKAEFAAAFPPSVPSVPGPTPSCVH